MDKYIVATLADDWGNFEVVDDGIFYEIADARERAFSAKTARPARKIGIYQLVETVTMTCTATQVQS